jgi:alanine racemase
MTGSVEAGVSPTASANVDLGAFARNIGRLKGHIGGLPIMVVVKADAYGHGLINCARAARAAGADWIGAATPTEAVTLREAGDTGPLLCWLYGPDEDLAAVVGSEVDVAAHHPDQISMITAAAAAVETRARVHLKIDTGLHRNGAPPAILDDLCRAAYEAEQSGAIKIIGVWSHLAAADEPGHPSIGRQLAAFEAALAAVEEHGLRPELRHLANSAAAITLPEARYDLVRVGIASYGIEPAPGLATAVGLDLEPVMTLRAQLVAVKSISAGDGVSYGHTWIADRDTVIGLVPLGYADGVPVAASNRGEVQVGGRRAPIRGRVCMDQFVIDLGPGASDRVGDEVIVFSTPARGPTAADLAEACGTIGYEIVTRIGARVPRITIETTPATEVDE